MLNVINIMGRLVRDPELKRTNSGTAVCPFSIACPRDFKDSNGEVVTDWINCVAWKNTAEFLSRYGMKGRVVVVSGRLQSREYTKDGAKHTTFEVVVDNLYFADRREKEDKAAGLADKFDELKEDDEELPF